MCNQHFWVAIRTDTPVFKYKKMEIYGADFNNHALVNKWIDENIDEWRKDMPGTLTIDIYDYFSCLFSFTY